MDNLDIWMIICTGVTALFTLATLIVYSVVPEVKNLQGSLLRRYLAAYLNFCVLWIINYVSPRIDTELSGNKISLYVAIISGVVEIFFACACMFWLNVMSFAIWRKFRTMSPRPNVNQKRDDRVKLVRYSVYAWGSALVFSSFYMFEISIERWLHFYVVEISLADDIIWSVIFLWVGISNTCLYILTAITIRKRKKETSHLVDGVNRHHKKDEQWFDLYVKLFVVMGVRIILVAIHSLLGFSACLGVVLYAIKALDSIFVFLIFAWKDDIKRSFRQQFVQIMHKLGSSLRYRSTTPAVENVNEDGTFAYISP